MERVTVTNSNTIVISAILYLYAKYFCSLPVCCLLEPVKDTESLNLYCFLPA